MAPPENNVTALARTDRQLAPRDAFDWTPEQLRIIKDSCAPGASDMEFSALIYVARVKRLDPMQKQIYFIKRNVYNSETKRYEQRWTFQTAIDGFRGKAQSTGQSDGQDEPDFSYDEQGRLLCCKVKVYRKGIGRPFVGVAHWSEYVQLNSDGNVTKMWADKPHVMLSKCAEAQALRKAFPDELAGLYVPEEMGEEREETAAAAVTVIDAARPAAAAPAPTVQPVIEHKPLREDPVRTNEEPGETIPELMARWKGALFTAQTLAECDKLGREIGKRLQPGTPEHDAALALYKARKVELKTRHTKPNGTTTREPGSDDA